MVKTKMWKNSYREFIGDL